MLTRNHQIFYTLALLRSNDCFEFIVLINNHNTALYAQHEFGSENMCELS